MFGHVAGTFTRPTINNPSFPRVVEVKSFCKMVPRNLEIIFCGNLILRGMAEESPRPLFAAQQHTAAHTVDGVVDQQNLSYGMV
jgi:hypothetical protein